MECYKRNSGMITVEMALIFPLLFFSILCICSLGLYFMDIAKLSSKVQEVLVYASESVGRGEDVAVGAVNMKKRNRQPLFSVSYVPEQKQLEEAIHSELQKQLLYIKLKKVTVSIRGDDINATILYRADHNLWHWFSLRNRDAMLHQSVRRIRYAEQLRLHRVYKKGE